MKPEINKGGFLALSRQGAMILAIGTTIWCLMSGVPALDTFFRAAVVYLTLVIISYVVSNMVARSIGGAETIEVIETPSDLPNESRR